MYNIDLCQELTGLMKKLKFNDKSVLVFSSDSNFISALHKTPEEQKVHLVLLINNIFLKAEGVVPSKIRLALTISTDIQSWLADMYTVIFPFLKANEEVFFN